jgi:type 2 lantibiotic biosynthesis protein LanM
MDFKKLSWFFADDIARTTAAFAASAPGSAGLLDAMHDNLLRSLFVVGHKVLVAQYKLVEADVAFDDYCESLRLPEIRAYLHERFPALQPAVDAACAAWLAQSCALTRRLLADADALADSGLRAAGPLRVASIRFGLGDPHRGGKSVALVTLADGGKLVYKPRSLAIDGHFRAMLDWLNARCGTDLRVPAHLDRGDYGWVGFVEPGDCDDAAQVEGFYERLGCLLGLLYVLEGTDFHYENIIAAGGHPVLIDLESFFRPLSPIDGGEANEAIDSSVLKVGILPSRVSADDLPDLGGIHDVEGQPGLNKLHLVKGADGRPALVRARGGLVGAHNVPRLDGAKVQLGPAHVARLREGFERVYRAILGARDDFAALVDACADDQVRIVFRHTATYVHLLDESRHPALMLSTEATARHFDLLRLVVPDYQVAARFVDFEIGDLHRGDIPLFTTKAGSRDLWYGEHERLPDFFVLSGLEAVRRKLALLSTADLDRQLWIIGNAFASQGRRTASVRGPLASAAPAGGDEIGERLLARAIAIADDVRAQMHVTADSASWLVHSATSLDNRQFELSPAFYDLHYGMPGEILFLTQLAHATGRVEYHELASKALHYLMGRVRQSSASIRPLGLYAGWGSVLHMLTALARFESNFTYLEWLEELLADPEFDRLIAVDANYGLLKGGAGFMLACSDLHLSNGSPRALQLALATADHLLSRRWDSGPGYSWRITSAVPLSGLAHGASGFALAFARLYEATGDARHREASLQALDYERSLFVPAQANWRDCRDAVVRERGEGTFCSVAWAHGAPGIGLARLGILRAGIDTPGIREDLAIAMRTTLDQGFDGGDSLTYGSFGNLELPISYTECIGDEYLPRTLALAGTLLDRLDAGEIRLGAPVANPLGLMTGVTGIGYQCLRLARLHRIPSVLCGVSRLCA